MDVYQNFRRWRRYRVMVRELDSYSRHELAELGIAPQDIRHVARAAAQGRP